MFENSDVNATVWEELEKLGDKDVRSWFSIIFVRKDY